MTTQHDPDPWVRGFCPPGGTKCPLCKRVFTLVFTGNRDQTGNHVYKCSVCDKYVGAPTVYASCSFYNLPRMEKDIFFSPCIMCPKRRVSATRGVCIHFKEVQDFKDLDSEILAALEKTIKDFKLDKHDAHPQRRDVI